MKQKSSARSAELRRLMQTFIGDRLAAKVEKLEPDNPKYAALMMQYQFDNWVEMAAKQVRYLQIATHIVKGVHPSAKGTDLLIRPSELPEVLAIGSHILKDGYLTDLAVENAAALYVFEFLNISLGGLTLLDLMLSRDPDLKRALSQDEKQSERWIEAFTSIVRSSKKNKTSALAKQIYWLVGDDPTRNDDFHLLSPLYPSALAHRIYQHIQNDRFSDDAKAARQARRDKNAFEVGFVDYPNLAVQKLGGANTQNVSKLNQKRRGINYLLASLPPTWHSRSNRPPFHVDSVFPRFMREPKPRWLVETLRAFLRSNPPANRHTRLRVDALVDSLIEELILFSVQIQQLESGWSAEPGCRLVEAEQLWLDPGRAEQDEAFWTRRSAGDWVDEVQNRFANQVNSALQDLQVGEHEQREWRRRVDRKLYALREVIYV